MAREDETHERGPRQGERERKAGAGGWRVHRYAVISLLAYVIDITVLTALLLADIPVFFANCVSAGTALSFIFVVARRRLFAHRDGWKPLLRQLAIFIVFNSVTILIASSAIAILAEILENPINEFLSSDMILGYHVTIGVIASLVAKAIINPLRAYTNYVLLGWLMEKRISLT